MTIAGRKGKLSIAGSGSDVRDLAWQRYEDVLTSDVFGAYRYLPPQLGIVPFLQHAVDENGLSLSGFLRQFEIDLELIDIVRIRFWPTLADGREPDLLVVLESTVKSRSVGLLVEAKLDASQHTIEGKSQIGHYLCQHLLGKYAAGSIPSALPDRPRPLLFVTRHLEVPRSELRQARAEVRRVLPEVPDSHVGVFWVSWFCAADEANHLWQIHRKDVASSPWLRHLLDLCEELRERDLVRRAPFGGFRVPIRCPQWNYERSTSAMTTAVWTYARNSLGHLPAQREARASYIRGNDTTRRQLSSHATRCYARGLLGVALRSGTGHRFYESQEQTDG